MLMINCYLLLMFLVGTLHCPHQERKLMLILLLRSYLIVLIFFVRSSLRVNRCVERLRTVVLMTSLNSGAY